jgi:LuxR family maltose regulon positive regulatory protein
VACCKQWGHTQHLIDSYLALINSLFAQGKVAAATAALTAARLVATAGWHRAQEEGTQPIAAHELVVAIEQRQLQLWLRQGRWTDAAQWLADHATDEQPALCFARVRLALAHHQPAVAQHWLTHMQQRLSGHLSLSGEVKLLLLQAQWHQQQGDLSAALVALRAALTLAEPSGHLRVFLDEGAAVAALLHRLVQAERGAAYAQRLCALFGQQESLPAVTEAAMPAQPPLVEPLSARELDVLQLIAVDLTYEAIGEQLSISLNTVRTHTKNIYSKLNVNRRQQAVTRARLLGLLP